MKIINEIIDILNKAEFAAIVCHSNPDGDTLGSAFALSSTLYRKQIKSDVLCHDVLPDNYSFLNEIQLINDFDRKKYDTIIFVDCADLSMAEKLNIDFDFLKYKTINIDHHKTNTRYAKLNYIDDNSSSTAELILNIIKKLNINIDKKIAEYIYLAIITDTGQFAYPYTSSKTHKNAAYLIEKGANITELHKKMFNTISLPKAELLMRMLKNMEIFNDGKIIISTLSIDDFKYAGANIADTESLINILLSIKDTKAAVLIRQNDENICKVSFRSIDDINISTVAEKLGGGGHKQAAGATLEGSINTAKKNILELINSMDLLK